MRELILTTDGACASQARDFAAACMQDAGVSDDEAFDMLLALNEAVTNVCRHAFAIPTQGEITVNCGRRGKEFSMRVTDTGKGFPFTEDMFEMPDPLSMRGRGFSMMKELMDFVDVRTGGVGTVISMKRKIGSKHLTDQL